MDFSAADLEALAAAVRRLEHPSLAGRLAALAGKPVGFVQRALPAAASTMRRSSHSPETRSSSALHTRASVAVKELVAAGVRSRTSV